MTEERFVDAQRLKHIWDHADLTPVGEVVLRGSPTDLADLSRALQALWAERQALQKQIFQAEVARDEARRQADMHRQSAHETAIECAEHRRMREANATLLRHLVDEMGELRARLGGKFLQLSNMLRDEMAENEARRVLLQRAYDMLWESFEYDSMNHQMSREWCREVEKLGLVIPLALDDAQKEEGKDG